MAASPARLSITNPSAKGGLQAASRLAPPRSRAAAKPGPGAYMAVAPVGQ